MAGLPNAASVIPRCGFGIPVSPWFAWSPWLCRFVHLWYGVGLKGISGSQRRREGRKQATTNVVARFRDGPAGPPTSWVPPWFLLPTVHPAVEIENQPTSLEEGRGTWWAGGSWLEGWWWGDVILVVVDERRMDG